MSAQFTVHEFTLEPNDSRRLANLCGPLDQHLRQIEQRFAVEIHNRGNQFHLRGTPESIHQAGALLDDLYQQTGSGEDLTSEQVHLSLQGSNADGPGATVDASADDVFHLPHCTVKAHGPNQRLYMRRIQEHDINFGIGPAGTGKTEKLGFLPGDLSQKINPYLRPLYDALYTMLGFEQVSRLVDRNVIEVAPLAYMRGRTLDNAFIILDEGQNSTRDQMKMFLTRLGFSSIAVVTGDITQIDLDGREQSGLTHAAEVLGDVGGISMTWFTPRDVVRHPLVQRIVEAYDRHENGGPGPRK